MTNQDLILCHQILREQHGYTWHIVSITWGMEKVMWDPQFNAAILTLELYLKLNQLISESYKRKGTVCSYWATSHEKLCLAVISPQNLNPVKLRKWFKQQWCKYAPLVRN